MNSRQILEDSLVDHLPYIRRVVGKVAKNCDVVDDLSQEVCVRIIEKEKLWNKNINQLSAWMNSIARNLTLDYGRKKKELPLEEKGNYLLHPEVESFSEEQIEWVVTQFQTLTQKQQQILNMKYYQDMTATQIGKEIGMANQTVSHNIASALTTLRKKAKSQGLLSLLLPWNWGRRVANIFVMNRVTEVITIVLVLGFVGFIGVKIQFC